MSSATSAEPRTPSSSRSAVQRGEPCPCKRGTLGARVRNWFPWNRLVAIFVATFVTMFVVVDAHAQTVALGGSPGSLYAPSGVLADSGRDLRAAARDDVVTIIVNESTSAVSSGVTNSARTSTATAGITALAGTVPKTGALANLLTSSGAQSLAGSGQTTRVSTLATTVSVRVVDVLANGTLVVEGTKDLAVNSEHQTVVVRGLVRPADLTIANTVFSTQVGNLDIRVNGKGVVNDAIRRPFFLYRLLLGLLPF